MHFAARARFNAMQRSNSNVLRKIIAVFILCSGAGLITVIFWKQEIKYSLPTEIPAQYVEVLPGEPVVLPSLLKNQGAYFLHFYNPDCPCSRFNSQHIQSLINNHSDSVHFAIVIASAEDLDKAKNELGSDLEFVVDTDFSIAKSCGVYSTPQAAIISHDRKLYYRGNYNRSRYCTTRATNFAELSLIALLNNQKHPPSFGILATQSYGCELADSENSFELF
jgi:hypothetical protein